MVNTTVLSVLISTNSGFVRVEFDCGILNLNPLGLYLTGDTFKTSENLSKAVFWIGYPAPLSTIFPCVKIVPPASVTSPVSLVITNPEGIFIFLNFCEH